jgi:hypothetical protein
VCLDLERMGIGQQCCSSAYVEEGPDRGRRLSSYGSGGSVVNCPVFVPVYAPALWCT